MLISLGFGVLFATVITLLLVPALYMTLEDIHDLFCKMFGTGEEHSEVVQSGAAPAKA